MTKKGNEKVPLLRGSALGGQNDGRHPAELARERGATVERGETGERAMFAPAGRITARAGLRSKLAAIVLAAKRSPPENPKVVGQRDKS